MAADAIGVRLAEDGGRRSLARLFAAVAEERDGIARAANRRGVVEAPYRDVGEPLLCYLREITSDPDAVALVVMPELILTGWRKLLHNQRALYIKRLLLFEPRVILSSVPYQLPR